MELMGAVGGYGRDGSKVEGVVVANASSSRGRARARVCRERGRSRAWESGGRVDEET
jgi:hypothetical protein